MLYQSDFPKVTYVTFKETGAGWVFLGTAFDEKMARQLAKNGAAQSRVKIVAYDLARIVVSGYLGEGVKAGS